MSLKLVQTLHDALSRFALERDGKDLDGNASVMVQFAAGDYVAVKDALEKAKVDLGWKDKHAIADAAGVVSHTSGGQPLAVDTRMDMAAETLPDDDTAPPGSPATGELNLPAPGGADTRTGLNDRRDPVEEQ